MSTVSCCRGPQQRRVEALALEKGIWVHEWAEAAADILAGEFGYSKDVVLQMLELHGGSLPTVLDMLAQLQAEAEGELSSNGQVEKLLYRTDGRFFELCEGGVGGAAEGGPFSRSSQFWEPKWDQSNTFCSEQARSVILPSQ